MTIDVVINFFVVTLLFFIIWLANDIVGHFNLQNLFNDWSAWATLLTAAVALWIATSQQRHADAREEKLRIRKERAARAMLPFALSDLFLYCNGCIRIIESFYFMNDNIDFEVKLQAPALPERLIETIQNVMENSDSGMADILASFVNNVQIQNSRFNSTYVAITSEFRKFNLINNIIDAVNLYADASRLLVYARGDDSKFSKFNHISNSASILKIYEEKYPEVFKIMRERGIII